MSAPPAVVGSLHVELIPVRRMLLRWPEQPESRAASVVLHPSSDRSVVDITVNEFAQGLEGHVPRPEIVDLARRLVGVALGKTDEPEITVDVDGALAFDLRLSSGELMFAELSLDGVLDLSVFDDSRPETCLVRHIPSASESEFVDQL